MTDLSSRIAEEIKARAGIDVNVELIDMVKNNGVEKEGYTIRREDERIAPTCYRQVFDDDKDVELIVDQYLNEIESSRSNDMLSIVDKVLNDPEKAYEVVIPTLVGSKYNVDNLDKKGIYHEKFLDMEIVYRLMINEGPTGMASVQITNAMIENMHYDIEEIRKHAIDNIVESFRIQSMAQVLKGFIDDDMVVDDSFPMYVIRTNNDTYGASTMISDIIMNRLHEILHEDKVVILPSSIHELIAVPESVAHDIEELRCMVRDVNSSQVAPDEVLTGSVYVHTVEKGLAIA